MINGYAPLWTLVYFDVDSTPEGRLALRRLRRKMRSLWSSPSFKQQSYHLVPINADRLEKELRPLLPVGTYSRLSLLPVTDKQIEATRNFYMPSDKETK